jgi:hypothetical protein
MSEVFVYVTGQFVKAERIKEICDRVIKFFPRSTVFGATTWTDILLEPERNLPILDSELISLGQLSIEGLLSLSRAPYEDFKGVLKKHTAIGMIGCLKIEVGFQERNSKQSKRAYDVLSLEAVRGKMFFTYSANGSLVIKDMSYRKNFMRRLIDKAQLPLEIEEQGEHFYLSRTSPGQLSFLRYSGSNYGSPSGFTCEVPAQMYDISVDILRACVDDFGAPKHFKYSWNVSSSNAQKNNVGEGKQIYDMVLNSNFPAEKYFIRAAIKVNSLLGLDTLKLLCGETDECSTPIASFSLNNDNFANLIARTTAKGHLLQLESRFPIEIQEIEKQLGVEFKKQT